MTRERLLYRTGMGAFAHVPPRDLCRLLQSESWKSVSVAGDPDSPGGAVFYFTKGNDSLGLPSRRAFDGYGWYVQQIVERLLQEEPEPDPPGEDG